MFTTREREAINAANSDAHNLRPQRVAKSASADEKANDDIHQKRRLTQTTTALPSQQRQHPFPAAQNRRPLKQPIGAGGATRTLAAASANVQKEDVERVKSLERQDSVESCNSNNQQITVHEALRGTNASLQQPTSRRRSKETTGGGGSSAMDASLRERPKSRGLGSLFSKARPETRGGGAANGAGSGSSNLQQQQDALARTWDAAGPPTAAKLAQTPGTGALIKETLARPLTALFRRPGTASGAGGRRQQQQQQEHVGAGATASNGAPAVGGARHAPTATIERASAATAALGAGRIVAASSSLANIRSLDDEEESAASAGATGAGGDDRGTPSSQQARYRGGEELSHEAAIAPHVHLHHFSSIYQTAAEPPQYVRGFGLPVLPAMGGGAGGKGGGDELQKQPPIDVSFLTRFLCAQEEVEEEAIPWSWDYLFTSVHDELSEEQNNQQQQQDAGTQQQQQQLQHDVSGVFGAGGTGGHNIFAPVSRL